MRYSYGMVLGLASLFSASVVFGAGDAGAGTRAANRAAARAAAKEKREATAAERKEAREKRQEKADDCINKRQTNQAKRITHGIKKGYLNEAEVAALQEQQAKVAGLETEALADGKLTKEEAKGIRAELNEASRCIWAEKHDDDGTQMATLRLGTNVYAKDDLTATLANENLSAEEAKVLMKDFRRLMDLKQQLSTGALSDAERTTLQAEYDTLLNIYFEVR